MDFPISQLITGLKMTTYIAATPTLLVASISPAITFPRTLVHQMLVGALHYAPGGEVAVKETISAYTVKSKPVLSGDRCAVLASERRSSPRRPLLPAYGGLCLYPMSVVLDLGRSCD